MSSSGTRPVPAWARRAARRLLAAETADDRGRDDVRACREYARDVLRQPGLTPAEAAVEILVRVARWESEELEAGRGRKARKK